MRLTIRLGELAKTFNGYCTVCYLVHTPIGSDTVEKVMSNEEIRCNNEISDLYVLEIQSRDKKGTNNIRIFVQKSEVE